MTLTFNPSTYNELLVATTPKVIETELEYERILTVVEKLTFKRDRTPEETALHKLLAILIEVYENEHYPMSQVSPNEVLCHIMEASGTHQADLVGILGSGEEVAQMMSGERIIDETQASILAEWFKVSPDLFLC